MVVTTDAGGPLTGMDAAGARTPQAHIQGQVLDGATGAPLEGVRVQACAIDGDDWTGGPVRAHGGRRQLRPHRRARHLGHRLRPLRLRERLPPARGHAGRRRHLHSRRRRHVDARRRSHAAPANPRHRHGPRHRRGDACRHRPAGPRPRHRRGAPLGSHRRQRRVRSRHQRHGGPVVQDTPARPQRDLRRLLLRLPGQRRGVVRRRGHADRRARPLLLLGRGPVRGPAVGDQGPDARRGREPRGRRPGPAPAHLGVRPRRPERLQRRRRLL